jgi:ribosomal protein S18 acetylase RimI-like enzyme
LQESHFPATWVQERGCADTPAEPADRRVLSGSMDPLAPPAPLAPVTVRQATAADAEVVGELTEQAYRAGGFLDGDGGPVYAAELRDARRRIQQAVVLVAELDGTVVAGITLAAPGTPYAETAQPGELEVRMLAVAPRARRRGIAELLMRAAADHARRTGHRRVVLCTERPMLDAHRLYERLGYRRQPERDWTTGTGYELISYGIDLLPG